MSKNFLKIFAIAVVWVSVVFGGTSSGLVTAIDIEGGRVMFKAGTHTGFPSCATVSAEQSDEWGTWSFMLNTDDGKAKLALLLYVRQNGLQVFVSGNGLCDSWGDRETATIIRIKP
jgi:hypothetical protein